MFECLNGSIRGRGAWLTGAGEAVDVEAGRYPSGRVRLKLSMWA